MTASLNALMQALATNKTVLTELAAFLDEEQRSVVNLDAAAIDGQAERKQELMARLEATGASCQERLRQAAQELQLPQAETLSALMPRLAATERIALQQMQKALQALGIRVNRQLALNRELLDNSLNLVNDSLQFFNRMLTRRPTYGQQGMMMEGGSGIRLVNKEI